MTDYMCYELAGIFPIYCGMGCGAVVFGRLNPVSYGVAAFVCYSDVCVTEYISDLEYLWGYVCECCPFIGFFCHVVWRVLFYVLFDV